MATTTAQASGSGRPPDRAPSAVYADQVEANATSLDDEMGGASGGGS